MTNKDWDDTFTAGDCVSDHTTWNDMVATILHQNTSGTYKSNIYINDDETYVGEGAGKNITAGDGVGNTLVGHDAGNDLTTGDYNTIDEAVKKMVKKSKRFRPNNENASAYIENYQLYNDLYDNLASVYKRYGIQNEL